MKYTPGSREVSPVREWPSASPASVLPGALALRSLCDFFTGSWGGNARQLLAKPRRVSGCSDTRGGKRARQRNQQFVSEAPAQSRLLEKGLISNIFKTIRYLGESGLTPATWWEDRIGS